MAEGVAYIYDDLGRLHRVVDEHGDVATYNYDAVGNILSITRATVDELQPEVVGISPNAGRAGSAVAVTITGQNLAGGDLITDSDIVVTDSRTGDQAIIAMFEIAADAQPGQRGVTVDTGIGTRMVSFTILPPVPSLSIAPALVVLAPGAQGMFTVSLSSADVATVDVALVVAQPDVASVDPASVSVPPGETSAAFSIRGIAIGATTVTATSAESSSVASIFVGRFSGPATIVSSAVSVLVPDESDVIRVISAPPVAVDVISDLGFVLSAPVSVAVGDPAEATVAVRAVPVSIDVLESGALVTTAPRGAGVATPGSTAQLKPSDSEVEE